MHSEAQSIGVDLTSADLDRFARFRIPSDLLTAAQVCRVTNQQARERLGVRRRGDLSGILFPRIHPVSGHHVGYRVRRDNPEVESGQPKAKYISSVDRARLYFPPCTGCLLHDVSVTVVFVEAEISALALAAVAARSHRPVLAVALGGCWGWKGR